MWTIVIFLKENTIEVVPENWLPRSDKCYWPPYKGKKLASSIALCESPDSEWNIFPIRLLNGDKKYDDLIQARNDCNKAQYSSDLSEFEGTKRKSKRKQLSSSSSESDDSLNISLPTVPKCFEKRKDHSENLCAVNEIGKSAHRQDSSSQLEKSQFRQNISYCSGSVESSNIPPQQVDKEIGGSVVSEAAIREFQIQVLRKLNMLNIKMDQLSAEILFLQQSIVAGEKNTPQVDVDFNLPLRNVDEVERMEDSLKNEEYYKIFVAYLQKVGGHSEYDCVKRIFSRILTDEVADQYNWLGLKKKKALNGLSLAKATKDAVLKNKLLERVTEKSIETAMKSWLRHAKDRLKGAENKAPP